MGIADLYQIHVCLPGKLDIHVNLHEKYFKNPEIFSGGGDQNLE
jgi:hypothetical protein